MQKHANAYQFLNALLLLLLLLHDTCMPQQQALVRWGGAMLELAHFKQGEEADECIKEVSGVLLGL